MNKFAIRPTFTLSISEDATEAANPAPYGSLGYLDTSEFTRIELNEAFRAGNLTLANQKLNILYKKTIINTMEEAEMPQTTAEAVILHMIGLEYPEIGIHLA